MGACPRGPLPRACSRPTMTPTALRRRAEPCTSRRPTFSRPPAPALPMVHGCDGPGSVCGHASNCAPPSTPSTHLGAEPWSETARSELAATGETARRRGPGDPQRAHTPGTADRHPGCRGPDHPGDRRRTIPQPQDGRVPPAQHLPQTRHQVAERTRLRNDPTPRISRPLTGSEADLPTARTRRSVHAATATLAGPIAARIRRSGVALRPKLSHAS